MVLVSLNSEKGLIPLQSAHPPTMLVFLREETGNLILQVLEKCKLDSAAAMGVNCCPWQCLWDDANRNQKTGENMSLFPPESVSSFSSSSYWQSLTGNPTANEIWAYNFPPLNI